MADVFSKLRIQKDLVRSMPKKSRFKGSFRKQHGKRAQTLLKFAWQHIYHIYWSLCRILSDKKSLLVICKISRLFINTVSADGKYSLVNRHNLTQPIQIQLSRKQNIFSDFFSAFLKSSWNLEHFQKKRKKMTLMAEVFPKLRIPKNMVTSMSITSRFKGSFGKQHGKRAQTFLKFEWQNPYHIYWLLCRQLTF